MQGYLTILQLPELSLVKSFPLLLIQVGMKVHLELDGVQEYMPELNGTVPVQQSYMLPGKYCGETICLVRPVIRL